MVDQWYGCAWIAAATVALKSAWNGLFSPISYSLRTTLISDWRSESRISPRPRRSASMRIASSSLSLGSVE
jgi:hypothetical protein